MIAWRTRLVVFVCVCAVRAKLESDDGTGETAEHDRDLDDSSERIGATVTQISQHPYAAALMNRQNYSCSAIILNNYWTLTLSKCFESGIISSYVTHKNLSNYTVRVGSSYNNKAGSIYKIKMLINNFDLRVSALKMETPMVFNNQVQGVQLPEADDDVQLGYLASIIAWTPSGHMRVVNAPIIDASICEVYTKMLPGHYICVGGVQDPNRHFCRRDNGGAVIQNNTLVGISLFVNSCALYSKTHAFPKVSSFARWLDSVIWDEESRPTTTSKPTPVPVPTTRQPENATALSDTQTYFADPSKFMLTLPFDTINVPLEPAEDNSVIPRMSLYESYLQSLSKAKTSTTTTDTTPNVVDQKKDLLLQKYNKAMMMMPQQMFLQRAMPKRYDHYDYN